jgi:4-amino-4-deoxy-L-arabinose transferase-like glycosyltransferase
MTFRKRDVLVALALACYAGVLFFPALGAAHLFDWDELNFAEITREMIATGDYFRVHIDFQPFWEKPPLFFWLQAASMKLWGENEFAARFPNAALGVLTLPFLYFVGKRLSGRGSLGVLWALFFGSSFLPLLYAKSGIIDPLFNFWTMIAAMALADYYAPATGKRYSMRRILLCGAALGMATLAKGPAAIILLAGAWALYWIVRRKCEEFPLAEFAVALASALIVSLLWYGVELWQNGAWFFREFALYQWRLLSTSDAGHERPFYFHALALLIGCFAASAPALHFFLQRVSPAVFMERLRAFARADFANSTNDGAQETTQATPQTTAPEDQKLAAAQTFSFLMAALLAAVMAVFTLAQTKVLHYSSLAYFPLTFFAARAMDELIRASSSRKAKTEGRGSTPRFHAWALATLVGVGALWCVLLAAIPALARNPDFTLRLLSLSADEQEFARAALQAEVEWSAWYFAAPATLALGVVLALVCATRRRFFEMSLALTAPLGVAFLIALASLAPKADVYLQGAAIEFYKSLRDRPCYVRALGFKTFADLFYARKKAADSPAAFNMPPEEFTRWLLEGEIDKTAFFVCKIHRAHLWRAHPNLEELYAKNGYVFFRREPKKPLNLALDETAPMEGRTLKK